MKGKTARVACAILRDLAVCRRSLLAPAGGGSQFGNVGSAHGRAIPILTFAVGALFGAGKLTLYPGVIAMQAPRFVWVRLHMLSIS